MANPTKMRRRRTVLYFLAGVVLLVALLVSLSGSLSQLRDLRQTQQQAENELNQLQVDNGNLAEQVNESGSDAYIIRMARRMLGWVFPDDIRIVEAGE